MSFYRIKITSLKPDTVHQLSTEEIKEIEAQDDVNCVVATDTYFFNKDDNEAEPEVDAQHGFKAL